MGALVVNLKWHDAMAVAGRHFTKDEHSAGWPQTLQPVQIAALQRPYQRGTGPEFLAVRKHTEALRNALISACVSNALSHTATTTKVMSKAAQVEQPSRFASSSWLARDGFHMAGARIGYTHPAQYKDVTFYQIDAPAFAAWLAAQGQTPSAHIAAWFDAMGIDTDTRPIVPPASWAVKSPHGLQRCDGTADGCLVRLADVVTWLMHARELPCQNAVELVCTALAQSPSAANALYLLSENGYANVLKATHSFFYVPIMVVGEDYPEGTAEDKGLAGALKYMRSFWGESSAPGAGNWCGQHVLDPLAVRVSLAHRLWGYGRRGDEVVQEAAITASKPNDLAPPTKAQRKWWDIASPFMAKTLKDERCTTAKALYNALGATAGQADSPFERGEGAHRGSLIVREITQPLSLKTVQNHWQKLKDIATAT